MNKLELKQLPFKWQNIIERTAIIIYWIATLLSFVFLTNILGNKIGDICLIWTGILFCIATFLLLNENRIYYKVKILGEHYRAINLKLNSEHFWFLSNFFSMLEMALCFIVAGVAVVLNSVSVFLIFFMLIFLMIFVMVFSYIEGMNIRFKKDIENIKKDKREEKFKISKIEMILMVIGTVIASIVTVIIIYSVT